MIAVGPSNVPFSECMLETPGSLVWWYVDLVDESGSGAVCIWSFGLPFLPGVCSSARAGQPQDPRTRPSFNLAIYSEGKPAFYTLVEVPEHEAHWEGDTCRFGNSRFRSRVEDDAVAVDITFDATLSGPRLPLQGTLTVRGPRCQGLGGLRNPHHSWEPLSMGSAVGHLDVRCGEFSAHVQGRAYHDRNGGDRPLTAIGLKSWRWGRVALPDREIVFSVPDGEGPSTVIEVLADGSTHAYPVLGPQALDFANAWFGPRWPRRLEIPTDGGVLVIEQLSLVDDAPFYQRCLVRGSFGGASGPGVAERVLVDRMDAAWMRPFVNMRIDRGPASSLWLPLFNGPRPRRGWVVGRPR
ncbi:MAG: hypothetical protein AAGA48_16070 [Myxococcota bacterium]